MLFVSIQFSRMLSSAANDADIFVKINIDYNSKHNENCFKFNFHFK